MLYNDDAFVNEEQSLCVPSQGKPGPNGPPGPKGDSVSLLEVKVKTRFK